MCENQLWIVARMALFSFGLTMMIMLLLTLFLFNGFNNWYLYFFLIDTMMFFIGLMGFL